MTNGEKFKEIFKLSQVDECDLNVYVWLPIHDAIEIPLEWWNAEYKEPTTKNNLAHNLCDSCTNIGCEFQSGIVRTECAFYMPPQLEPDNCGNYVVQVQTTKNYIRYNQVKNELNRVKNELESTTKNDLGVDCISRADALDCVNWGYSFSDIYKKINELPSVTPQPRKGHWMNKQRLFDSCSAECSSCHKRSNGYVFDNGFSLESEYYDFCPKCGSDNREVEE